METWLIPRYSCNYTMKVQKEYRVREYKQKNQKKKKCKPLDPVKLPILSIKAQKQNLKKTCTKTHIFTSDRTTWKYDMGNRGKKN